MIPEKTILLVPSERRKKDRDCANPQCFQNAAFLDEHYSTVLAPLHCMDDDVIGAPTAIFNSASGEAEHPMSSSGLNTW